MEVGLVFGEIVVLGRILLDVKQTARCGAARVVVLELGLVRVLRARPHALALVAAKFGVQFPVLRILRSVENPQYRSNPRWIPDPAAHRAPAEKSMEPPKIPKDVLGNS